MVCRHAIEEQRCWVQETPSRTRLVTLNFSTRRNGQSLRDTCVWPIHAHRMPNRSIRASRAWPSLVLGQPQTTPLACSGTDPYTHPNLMCLVQGTWLAFPYIPAAFPVRFASSPPPRLAHPPSQYKVHSYAILFDFNSNVNSPQSQERYPRTDWRLASRVGTYKGMKRVSIASRVCVSHLHKRLARPCVSPFGDPSILFVWVHDRAPYLIPSLYVLYGYIIIRVVAQGGYVTLFWPRHCCHDLTYSHTQGQYLHWNSGIDHRKTQRHRPEIAIPARAKVKRKETWQPQLFRMVVEVLSLSHREWSRLPWLPHSPLVQIFSKATSTDAVLLPYFLQDRGILPPILQSMTSVFRLFQAPLLPLWFLRRDQSDMGIDTWMRRLFAQG
jgi:hypothetical protein